MSARKFIFIEFLFPLYILIILIIAQIQGDYFGLSFLNLVIFFASTVPLVGVVLGFAIVTSGRNDFRFKMTFHFIIAGYAAAIAGILWKGTGLLDLANNDPGISFSNAILNFGIIIGPTMILFVAAVLAAFSVTDPYTDRFRIKSRAYMEGNLNIQIEDGFILDDSVFGPLATFFNNIIKTSSVLISNIQSSNELLIKTSNKLTESTSAVDSATNQIADTSGQVSRNSSIQATQLNNAMNRILSTDDVVKDVIRRIQENAELVSEIGEQTGLLALNAKIEASRAGEFGKGFAIIAEHVRRLSLESNSAVENIIEVANSIDTILQTEFSEIQAIIENVASLSEETAAASEQVAASSEEFTSTMQEINSLSSTLSSHVISSNKVITEFLE
ncbi:MAG: hypothetical protein IH840_01085 [Candidatus Heimdallarchaeota archaeon]|nr:hypothetical protein [Candidatus Heimdallarchaeota archaeon]